MDLSANIERLQPSATIAVATLAKQLKSEGRDIIDLSAGEPDFDTPAWISEGAIDGIRGGRTRYTPVPGLPELRKAIASALQERTAQAVDWNGVVVSSGAKQAVFNACFSLFGPGDEVLVGSPYWTSYPEIVKLARAEPVFVSGAEERGFRLSPGDLDRVASERTRGLLFSTPCNPTGSVYRKDELHAVAEWARDRGVWVICDEIYREINFAADGSSAPSLFDLPAPALGPHVVVDGVSKCYAMTGWRIGYSYCIPALAKKFSALQSHINSNPATPSQMAALRAFETPQKAREEAATMTAAFRRRRDLSVRLMRELLPEIPFVPPDGAFYLFLRVDSTFGDRFPDSSGFCTWLLERTGVALVPGTAFGDDRFVRLSFATSDAALEEGIRRIGAALTG